MLPSLVRSGCCSPLQPLGAFETFAIHEIMSVLVARKVCVGTMLGAACSTLCILRAKGKTYYCTAGATSPMKTRISTNFLSGRGSNNYDIVPGKRPDREMVLPSKIARLYMTQAS